MTENSDNDGWLERYADSHQNLRYASLYWLAVLMVVVGLVGLLWTLPVPEQFYTISPLLNWGSAFLMVAAVYYFIISLSIAIGMLPFLIGVAAFHLWLGPSEFSALRASSGLLVGGTIGLWLGHRDRSGIRPVLDDLLHAMIGPAWMLSVVYRRLGIPY